MAEMIDITTDYCNNYSSQLLIMLEMHVLQPKVMSNK